MPHDDLKHRHSVRVCCFGISPILNQPFHHIHLPAPCCRMQDCPPLVVYCFDIQPILNQRVHHIQLPAACCRMQNRPTGIVCCIDISSMLNQPVPFLIQCSQKQHG